MQEKLNGIALILFAILFYNISDGFQEYLWDWRIGVWIPWDIIAFFIGISGLILVFVKGKKE